MLRSLSTSRNKNVGASEGFTLVELLLVIAIMGVLTTMALAFMRSANEQARVSATQSRINRIEAILNAELERYEVRRLPLSYGELREFVSNNRSPALASDGSQDLVQVKSLRQRILQALIDSELPRPFWTGIDPVTGEYQYSPNPNLSVFPAAARPDPAFDDAVYPSNTSLPSYGLAFSSWVNLKYPDTNSNGVTLLEMLNARAPSAAASWARIASPNLNLPGEYLYQILLRTDMDGIPAVETLGSATIGDSDGPEGLGDGFPEILDAWGEPMHFLILQVDAWENSENQELWNESIPPPDTIDWSNLNPLSADQRIRGLPVGTKRLNPVIPRDLQKIRLKVFSRRMGINNNFAPFYTVNGS